MERLINGGLEASTYKVPPPPKKMANLFSS